MRISDWSSDVCSSDLPCGSGGDMIAPGATLRVYVATRPVDFRKGHDGLAAAVQEMFGLDPFSGAVFVFRSKRADRVKLLFWDRTGLVRVHKRPFGRASFRDQVCQYVLIAVGAVLFK